MKITHLCIASFFPDNFSYQENLLPKYHKSLGFEVSVIAGLASFDQNGKPILLKEASEYINEHELPVKRLQIKSRHPFCQKLKWYCGIYEALISANPDIIFIHGCQFIGIGQVIKYLKKHPETKVFVDNHADFSNSAKNWFSKNILHKILWRICAQRIKPYTEKFYGVLPARVDFLVNVYRLPKEKCELIVMGADDDLVACAKKSDIRNSLRKEFEIGEEFVIITGGKIDSNKPEVLNLMRAVARLQSDNIKLIVFGSVTPHLKTEFEKLCESKKIIYIGWIDSREIYKYYAASDLAFFPGLHSVLWEEAVGFGIPCVFRDLKGFHHVDIGGNCRFIKKTDVESLLYTIEEIIENKEIYQKMLCCASSEKNKKFLYSKIAENSIL